MLYQRGKETDENGKKRKRIWWYRFRFCGRIVHESAHTRSKTVARDAEKERRRRLEETINGIKRRTLPPTFEQAAREWQAGRETRLAPKSIETEHRAIGHLLPDFGPKLLCDLTPEAIQSYQRKRQREGASNKTINLEIEPLRQILKAHDLWTPLAAKVRMLKVRDDVARALSPEEESGVLKAAVKADSACYTAVVLALHTAMRKDEIRLLRWRQVDWERRTVTVGKSKTDAGTGRLIPLNVAAFEALARWASRFLEAQPDHYVFPWCEHLQFDPTRPTKGWRTAWRRALKRAGFHCRFHDLRVTCITKLAETQASDMTIMAIAGHVSRRMLEHYSRIRTEAKRQALEAIAGSRQIPGLGAGVHQNGNQIGLHQNEAGAKLLN